MHRKIFRLPYACRTIGKGTAGNNRGIGRQISDLRDAKDERGILEVSKLEKDMT